MKLKKSLKKFIVCLIALGVVFFIAVFLITSVLIGRSVRGRCALAQEKYSGSCVETLTSVLANPESPYVDRNHVVWALGQLGDKEALPVLKRYYQGFVPDYREPYNEELSQYELSKAIKLLEGGWNLSAWVWRR